jgi:hypothetical protein
VVLPASAAIKWQGAAGGQPWQHARGSAPHRQERGRREDKCHQKLHTSLAAEAQVPLHQGRPGRERLAANRLDPATQLRRSGREGGIGLDRAAKAADGKGGGCGGGNDLHGRSPGDAEGEDEDLDGPKDAEQPDLLSDRNLRHERRPAAAFGGGEVDGYTLAIARDAGAGADKLRERDILRVGGKQWWCISRGRATGPASWERTAPPCWSMRPARAANPNQGIMRCIAR